MHKHKKHWRHGPHSIFWKLFFRLVIAGLLIMMLVVFFFRAMFSPITHEVTRQNIENYARYIIQDIGDPPDTLRAMQIARENNLIIYYVSQQLTWSSQKELPVFEDEDISQWHERPGWQEQHYFTRVATDGGTYYLGIDIKFNPENHAWMVALLILLILLVLAVLYLSIRHILRPVQWLSRGVRQVSTGNFDHQVRVWKMDQLGQLTTSFNNMIRKTKEMLVARNQLLLDVSHEMRSPLTRVKVALEFMPESENRKSISEDIAELEQMLTEILETERLDSAHQSLSISEFDLVPILSEITVKYQHTKPGIDLSGLPGSCTVRADAERLKMCLRNIIENSLKYSAEDNDPVQINAESGDAAYTIKIRDFGRGIPQDDLPFIFEPFYRVDKSRSRTTGGYGLGMSLCKKIIEAHHGTIEIASEENNGTIVTIILPKTIKTETGN